MHVDVYKRTSDDWLPSYILGDKELVLVSFDQINLFEFVVSAWGNAGDGMERIFDDYAKAWTCFLEVIGYDDVTMKSLDALGFVSA
jgi:hypothetical protein